MSSCDLMRLLSQTSASSVVWAWMGFRRKKKEKGKTTEKKKKVSRTIYDFLRNVVFGFKHSFIQINIEEDTRCILNHGTIAHIKLKFWWGGGVVQWVERRTLGPNTQRRSVRTTIK